MMIDYKLPDVLVANLTDTGACKKCCFNNFYPACFKMNCQTPDGKIVYWTLSRGSSFFVPELWCDYARTHPNYKKLCAEKVAQAQKTK